MKKIIELINLINKIKIQLITFSLNNNYINNDLMINLIHLVLIDNKNF